MTSPTVRRVTHLARKGAELGLRVVDQTAEQRAARRLAAQHQPGQDGSGPRVLILSPRDWAAQIQYEAVIAHGLKLRGAEVSFLTCGGGLEICDRSNTWEAPPPSCTSCKHYNGASISAHGFEVHSIEAGWRDDDPDWPELDLLSVAELATVTDRGLPLGELVDIPRKWFLCAADVDTDPLGGIVNRAMLRSARRIATGVAAVLDEVEPDLVLVTNGLFLFEAVAWELCRQRDIDVVTYERAFRKETLVFSRDVPAGHYDFSADWPRADRALSPAEERELDEYLTARRTGGAFDQYWQFEDHDVADGTDSLVSLFTNLTWDSAVIHRDLAFDSIRHWVSAAIEYFDAHREHRLVIRVHPSEVSLPGRTTRDSLAAYVHREHPVLPPNVRLVEPTDMSSSYPLMDASDVGLVYTSTTGMELALSGTPVIVAGKTHYRDKGFTIDVSSPEEFTAALDAALGTARAVDVEQARRYAHYFFFRAPITAPGVIEPIPGLARLSVDDLSQLRPGANPDLDRICDGLLDRASFAMPAEG